MNNDKLIEQIAKRLPFAASNEFEGELVVATHWVLDVESAKKIEALCREAFVGEIEKLIPMIISDLPKVEWLQKKHVIEAIKGMNTGDV